MKTPFQTIDVATLSGVTGGKTSAQDQQIQTLLTQLSDSIKDVAEARNKGSDPMQMFMMLAMMGGIGGGGGGGAPPPPPPQAPAPVVRVNVA